MNERSKGRSEEECKDSSYQNHSVELSFGVLWFLVTLYRRELYFTNNPWVILALDGSGTIDQVDWRLLLPRPSFQLSAYCLSPVLDPLSRSLPLWPSLPAPSATVVARTNTHTQGVANESIGVIWFNSWFYFTVSRVVVGNSSLIWFVAQVLFWSLLER